MSKKTRNVALTSLILGMAGYAVGVLTAPKSGKETRKDIQKKAGLAKSKAEKNLKVLHSELNELITAGKQKAKNAKATAKSELADALSKAQHAKEKAREMLSAIHEGDAEDEDLQNAIKEVNKSIENLKQYVKKDAKT